ncbi:ribokinase [Sporosarcina sp. ACRSM]|uniref:ribokinase n=1 Tax=Sporosarcina sp. ACRSM TaxID=2918216 RepID=UPI001EF3E69B|nr:ribokinase [Sporosarcina sp. ACRSM]MCG7335760.1 ribokinase [Sporosarcina sp. ACRSM]
MKESPSIVIIGSLNLDMVLQSSKFPEEGETIIGQSFFSSMGGKGANQAVAAARLGAEVSLIGAVGNDAYGEQLINKLKEEGVNTSYITKISDQPTGIACVHVSSNDNRITVIPGANYHLLPAHIDQAERLIEAADIVVLQMEIPIDTIIHGITRAKYLGKKIILNPAPAFNLPKDILSQIDYLTPNETELHILASGSDIEIDILNSAQRLLKMGVGNLIVTLGEKGARYFSGKSEEKHFSSHCVQVIDTTGAGDAFNGGLAYSLAKGDEVDEAITFATKVGAHAVTKLGAQAGMPSNKELDAFFMNVM